jgi:putative peptidoglycan lipid II flippase
MSQMLKSSGAMAGATLASRVLGLARETVYAAFMGNSWQASAFFLAFQAPNLFRRLLGEGALTAAFIPIFKSKEVTEGESEMWRSANAVISGLVVVAGALTVVVMLGLSLVLRVGHYSEATELMLSLLRMMFPYMLLVCLAAVLIGMANARGHFFVPALGSVILNVVMIGSVLWLAPHMGHTLALQIRGLAIGVVVAGLVQALFQVPSLSREGFRFGWVSPWRDPTVREVIRKMLPGSIGVAAFQINVLVTYFFSYWFDESIVSTFNYAVRLMELPQGMFGISLATYLLPTLSGLAGQKKFPEFRRTLGQGLGHLALANLIAAAIALALAEPIVRLLFERGKFDAETTQRVAVALKCLAPGLLMFSMNNILARAFYALGDVKTPMKISIFCLGVNLVFSLWLIRSYKEAGLGVANTLSASLNMGLLVYALRRKLARLGLTELTRSLAVLVPSAAFAGLTAAGLAGLWGGHFGHTTLMLKLGQVFVPAAAAGVLYGLLAFAFKVPAAREMAGLLVQRLGRTPAPAA